MSFSMISSMGNFLPKKTVVAGGGTNTNGPSFAVAPNFSLSTWNYANNNKIYKATAMSSDGKYILICVGGISSHPMNLSAIYLSSNNGVSFTQLSSSTFSNTINWTSCAISSTGNIMVVGGEGTKMYKSTNYGVSWTPIHTLINCASINLSYTGQYCLVTWHSENTVYAVVFNNFLVNNTGITIFDFFVTYNPQRTSGSAYVSQSGKYMSAVCSQLSGGIAISTDYGVTWTKSNYGIPFGTSFQFNYWGTTITYDESKIYIIVISGSSHGIYILPISGVNIGTRIKITSYSQLNGLANGVDIESIAISKDGTYIIVGGTRTQSYYSKNSGETWELVVGTWDLSATNVSIYNISMSEDARNIVVLYTQANNSGPFISKA